MEENKSQETPVEGSVESPYVKSAEEVNAERQAKIDQETKDTSVLIKHQQDTAGKAAIEVLALFADKPDLVLLSLEDKESKKKYDAAYQDMLAQILVVFAKNDVSFTDYDYVFAKLRSVINDLSGNINRHSEALRHEIISRVVEKRDPVANKFNSDFATHADLINAVLKLREAQGGGAEKADDYFTITG